MPVRIFCTCGAEVTKDISLWDRKTRTVFWMDEHPPLCPACQARNAASSIGSARDSGSGGTEIRKKLAAR
jgi:hypothetical protein